MAQLEVVKIDKSKAGTFDVSDQITEAAFNPFLIKDAVVYQMAKARQGTHATKTRSMVTGSGKKLYRQKGTGSARTGDAKAPRRRGAGIAHGPHPRSHAIDLNKKVRKAALRSALAEKIRREEMIVVETFEVSDHKTKALSQVLGKLEAPNALIVTHDLNRNLELAARNLPQVDVIYHGQLNVYNLLRFPKTVITRDALQAIQERLTG